jgi:hypothetical protein
MTFRVRIDGRQDELVLSQYVMFSCCIVASAQTTNEGICRCLACLVQKTQKRLLNKGNASADPTRRAPQVKEQHV